MLAFFNVAPKFAEWKKTPGLKDTIEVNCCEIMKIGQTFVVLPAMALSIINVITDPIAFTLSF
jgi:hypothetical protein